MYKNKLSYVIKTVPLFHVIAKCYKLHRYLPSTTLKSAAHSLLPHGPLLTLRLVIQRGESETWRKENMSGGGGAKKTKAVLTQE